MGKNKIIFYLKTYIIHDRAISFSDYHIEPYYEGQQFPIPPISFSRLGYYKGIPIYEIE